MPGKFLTAEWKNLIMANYVIDPDVLQPYLPAKTILDDFNGKVYVSLIGFMFSNTRIFGIRIPFHGDFEEVNLRFYVRHDENGDCKRGVVFVKEIVPKPAVSFIANTFYHEKYSTKRMKHFYRETPPEINLGYHWKHKNRWNKIEATAYSEPRPMVPGSEEEFIAGQYWGYTRYNAGTTFEYAVQHPAWKIFPVKNYFIDCDFTALYGAPFSFLNHAKPPVVFVTAGSEIAVLKKRKL